MVNIHRRGGFTIVELLIVIVVIAILAAISIVSYTGIQQRANNTVTLEATAQLVKAYGLYAAENGSLPTGSGCIGERYPGNTCLSQNGASACFGLGGSGVSESLHSALKPYTGGSVPMPSTQRVACGGTTYSGLYVWYNAANQRSTVVSILGGDVACPAMSPNVTSQAKVLEGSATRCTYVVGL